MQYFLCVERVQLSVPKAIRYFHLVRIGPPDMGGGAAIRSRLGNENLPQVRRPFTRHSSNKTCTFLPKLSWKAML